MEPCGAGVEMAADKSDLVVCGALQLLFKLEQIPLGSWLRQAPPTPLPSKKMERFGLLGLIKMANLELATHKKEILLFKSAMILLGFMWLQVTSIPWPSNRMVHCGAGEAIP